MIILGIESSCDDTSVALVESSDRGHFVLSEKTASQIEIHKKYGGVVPEIAGRLHAEKIAPLIEAVLTSAPQNKNNINAIAVTSGPGLITGLLVGTTAARALSLAKKIPIVRVNHLDGHLHSVEIGSEKILFPALAVIVSGGHTELILMRDHGDYQKLGSTVDDAAGECFDKVAKLLDLPYPGGPQISKLAETGNTKAIDFPRPMLDRENYAFSFAGLKTSALYWLRDNKFSDKISVNDFCASFEEAIVDVIVKKSLRAAKEFNPKTVILSGGVAANNRLRTELEKNINNLLPEAKFLRPEIKYCMDNAAMIAVAGSYLVQTNQYTDWRDLKADPNWEI